MSGVTKADLEVKVLDLNAEVAALRERTTELSGKTIGKAEQLNQAEAQRDHYRTQRDRLVGFLQGYRKDIGEPIEDTPDYSTPSIKISRVDAFLGECREDPPIRDGASPRPLR